ALVEMRGDRFRRAIVETAQRIAIGGVLPWNLRRHRIEQRQLLDAVLEMRGGDASRVAGVAGLGEMRHHVGGLQRRNCVQGDETRIAGADTDAEKTRVHRPSFAKALTAAAVMAM